jgi:hypothetical protein
MRDPSPETCGPHEDLAENDTVAVSRCPCGTYHLHLHEHGITLRLEEDEAVRLLMALTESLRHLQIQTTAYLPN